MDAPEKQLPPPGDSRKTVKLRVKVTIQANAKVGKRNYLVQIAGNKKKPQGGQFS